MHRTFGAWLRFVASLFVLYSIVALACGVLAVGVVIAYTHPWLSIGFASGLLSGCVTTYAALKLRRLYRHDPRSSSMTVRDFVVGQIGAHIPTFGAYGPIAH